MTRRIWAKEKYETVDVSKYEDKAFITIRRTRTPGHGALRVLGSVQLDKFRLGLLIDNLTALYNEIDGDLKEVTMMVPKGSVIIVDGEQVPNE